MKIMLNLTDRFKEPSSWAGIAVAINMLGPVLGVPPGAGDVIVNALAGLAALAAFFMKEQA